MKRKCVAVGIILLFIGTATTVIAEPSDVLSTKMKTILGLHDSSRDQVELRYYNPNTLYGAVGGPSMSPQTWRTAIRLTQTELAAYKTWNLTQVVIGFSKDPYEGRMNVTIIIYDTGDETHPGPVIVNDTNAILNRTDLITVPLVTPVSLAGHTELWVCVQWIQKHAFSQYAVFDMGPAADKKGDWVFFNNEWDELQHMGMNVNWAIGAIVEGQNPNIFFENIKGPFGITAELRNTGSGNAYNITWSISVEGGLLGRVDKSTTGIALKLSPNQTLSISMPPFLGFGTIYIDLKAQAANAEETYSDHTAFLLGPFVIGIR